MSRITKQKAFVLEKGSGEGCPLPFLTLGIAGVSKSVGTRVVGIRSLISCMTQNIPYKITIFIRNMI